LAPTIPWGEGHEWYPNVKMRKLKTVHRHLEKHRVARHVVPDDCFERIREEISVGNYHYR
jgi:hypothetical protein